MPTGYTYKLVEGGESFRDFALRCYRAFGALIEMRDDSPDAKIPDKFEASDHHKKKLREARDLQVKLKKMTLNQRIAFGGRRQKERISSCRASIEKIRDENGRLDAMSAQVFRWQPPSSDHEALKKFMLDQIEISKNTGSYVLDELRMAVGREPIDYYNEALKSARRDIGYHMAEDLQEERRVFKRNIWIDLLRESLPKK